MKDIMGDPRINNYNFFSKVGISSSFSGPLTGDSTEDTDPHRGLKEGLVGKGSFQKRIRVYRMPQNLGEVSEIVPQHQLAATT